MTTLVQQKTPNDCVLAAIAMAADKQYDDLWTPEDTQWCVDNKGISDYKPWLARAGFHPSVPSKNGYRYVYGLDNMRQESALKLLWGRRAILSVASLNREGSYHAVYWNGYELFDPSLEKTFNWLSSVSLASAHLLGS